MNDKEQIIEEMIDDLMACHTEFYENAELYTDYPDMAENLYSKGYRKQSENVIELPCKVGDTVYIIEECGDGECAEDYVLDVKVSQFFINKHGIAVDLALPLGIRLNTWMEVGKNVFFTREEAEKALERIKQ